MIGSWHPTPVKLLGSALMLGVALAGPALAQTVAPAQTVVPGADKAARDASAPPPCTDCRGGEAGLPSSSNTIITTPDGKTIVPRTVIREQADFRLNDALRNVPGVNRR
jgi:outer membrane receptor for monomeric catechols